MMAGMYSDVDFNRMQVRRHFSGNYSFKMILDFSLICSFFSQFALRFWNDLKCIRTPSKLHKDMLHYTDTYLATIQHFT